MTDRLVGVLSAIDALNAEDPNDEDVDDQTLPRESLYAARMSQRLADFVPNASDELQIAVRAQHIQRWKKKRADYPEGKAGYHQWRRELGKMHADITVSLMEEAGYAEDFQQKVRRIISKQGIKQDEEVQTLEDVACLVFLEHYFLPFAAKHSEEKVIRILKKTWQKMSSTGQSEALNLPLDEKSLAIIRKALG